MFQHFISAVCIGMRLYTKDQNMNMWLDRWAVAGHTSCRKNQATTKENREKQVMTKEGRKYGHSLKSLESKYLGYLVDGFERSPPTRGLVIVIVSISNFTSSFDDSMKQCYKPNNDTNWPPNTKEGKCLSLICLVRYFDQHGRYNGDIARSNASYKTS